MRCIARFFALRERDLEIKSGSFHCPNCGKRTYCSHRKIEDWQPFFLAPLCAPEVLHVSTRCVDCRRSYCYGTAAPFFPAGGPLLSDMRAELRAGGPVEGIIRLLYASGIDEATSDAVIRDLVGKIRNACPACSLTYLPTVPSCKRCGSPLSKHVEAKPDPFDELA